MTKAKSGVHALGLVVAAWVFALEYSLYLVRDDIPDKLIKVGAALIMLLYLRYRRGEMEDRDRLLLTLFFLLLLTALVPSIFVGDVLTGISQWVKIALMTTVLPLLLVNRRMNQKNADLLLSVYVWLGVAFSIQAIFAFCAVMWDMVDTSVSVEIGRRPGVAESTIGMFGYANAIRTPLEGTRWLRPQGWFLEPSLLGAFLLLPAFVSFGRFLQYRKLRFLGLFVTIFTAILLTISLATYLGLIVGMSFLILSRLFYGGLSRISRALRYAYPILILATFFGVAVSLIGFANKASEVNVAELEENAALLTQLYARDPNGDSGNLFREVASADSYLSAIASNPVGVGFGQTLGENEIISANGLLFWGVTGGVPALVILVIFFGCIFYVFCHPLLISDNIVYRCIAASFIGHAVHNLSYGNWLAPYFLIHLAIVCMTVRQAKQAPRDAKSILYKPVPATSRP